ncbi:trinucleotide repeat-containing gene 6B protein-like [Wyeomyia smithii]|uniref:trinucleotide repeat-containing gene 6B protein-like n=1 Tax=Wyeomyia smithii TaxID=174621 RepID=UPI002467C23B|nr:trinucleotide repeat-containing gene 6B protein-like [Wyeomyia smithii]XP_055549733.1 trinucleotide repeat-containing gene 6B protein-like [Wyeomyia smithii]
MKVISAILLATLAVAAQGSYAPASYWPSHSGGWNSWNNGWNGNQVASYPYAKTWASSWPAAGLYSNGWNGHYGAVEKVPSWGQPWGSYGAKTIIPSVKVNAWDQPWGNYGAGWGYENVAKTVVPSVKVNSWGLPWGSYGAGAYGWEQPEVIKTVVPVAKQVAYVAPVHAGVEKVLVQPKW